MLSGYQHMTKRKLRRHPEQSLQITHQPLSIFEVIESSPLSLVPHETKKQPDEAKGNSYYLLRGITAGKKRNQKYGVCRPER
jgi:hypothetical protein